MFLRILTVQGPQTTSCDILALKTVLLLCPFRVHFFHRFWPREFWNQMQHLRWKTSLSEWWFETVFICQLTNLGNDPFKWVDTGHQQLLKSTCNLKLFWFPLISLFWEPGNQRSRRWINWGSNTYLSHHVCFKKHPPDIGKLPKWSKMYFHHGFYQFLLQYFWQMEQ